MSEELGKRGLSSLALSPVIKRLLFVILIFVLFFIALSPYKSCSTDKSPHDLSIDMYKLKLDLIESIESSLISNGACLNSSDCTKKQIFFIKMMSHGYAVSLYSINNQKTIADVINACASKYLAANGVVSIEINVYKNSFNTDSSGLLKYGLALPASGTAGYKIILD